MKDYSGGQVHRHQGRLRQEEVVEADHVPVVGQHVAEPRDQPRQREDRAQLRPLQVGVEAEAPPAEERVHVLQEADRLLHGGGHELPQVGDREPLHDLVAKLLTNDQQECYCNVMITCTITKLSLLIGRYFDIIYWFCNISKWILRLCKICLSVGIASANKIFPTRPHFHQNQLFRRTFY